MTTTLTIKNEASSNGDVLIRGSNLSSYPSPNKLTPGQQTTFHITDSSQVSVIEDWPSKQLAPEHIKYGDQADAIIAKEVAGQDRMWGVANERADSSKGQLLAAGLAQANALLARRQGQEDAFDVVPSIYPPDWSGFRDYGSDVANLAVAAAFIRQEIKRLLSEGADTTRLARDQVKQPYKYDQPAEPFPAS